ncbi:MAG: hypothetical protein DWC10_01275 [Candidatus Poseidoniales archaeon]|nr:MAG: hypothetical protein DWC10_01275 [Candidatus Poseidoniales archaeon]
MCGHPPTQQTKRPNRMSVESIEASVARLADTAGGQILASIRDAIQRSLKFYIAFFAVGFMVAFPLTSDLISWLIHEERLPAGVDIIVISPVEFIFLQLRVAGYAGLVLVAMFVVGQVAVHGVRHQAVQERLRELELQLPRPGPTVVLAILGALVLMVLGMAYAWYGLIPLLLEYLTTDAQQAGLSTEWRLSGYAGFIVNLLAASAIGFQAPLLTLMILRSGMFTRQQLAASRRGIWFAAFVMGAFLSPPDPLSLFLVSLPVILLFEAAMLVDRFTRG